MDNSKSDKKRNRTSDHGDGLEVKELPTKRPRESAVKTRNACQYGVNCYRRSPSHFKDFKHPELESLFVQLIETGSPISSVEVGSGFPDSSIARAQLGILQDSGILRIIKLEKGNELTSNSSNSASSNFTVAPSKSTAIEIETSKDEMRSEVNILSTSGSNSSSSQSISFSSSVNPQVQNSDGSGASNANLSRASGTGNPLSKWEASCPFNFFLTRTPDESKYTSYSMSFQELFHPSFGEVYKICHFNFMVEAEWFLEEVQIASMDGKDTTVIFGVESTELEEATRVFPWLKVHLVKSPFPFGHHHTKMSLIQYSDESMRFVIYTANLIESDWESRTQGLWMSPKCPKIEEGGCAKSSVTGTLFKAHLIEYLSSYPPKCGLSSWINPIRKLDTSEIKVLFIGSAPVTAQSHQNGFQWGQKKMETMLKRFQPPSEMGSNWPLLIQCSSIGSLGPTDEFLRTEFGRQLGTGAWSPSTPVRVVYPSDRNVRGSCDGIYGGSCLPYSRSTHVKQTWLKKLLHQWRSDLFGRSRIMPHIKTYGRISPDGTKLAWFAVTSANLSKAAWGKLNKNQDRLTVMSWEAGVLFIPQHFGFSAAFPISTSKDPSPEAFLLPFDLPLTKYEGDDEPWQIETLRDAR